ncbi:hypothetical protein [Parasedimentitalea huanghaiensis]|uniref:hypothetical protein n=1 Tax=Parasedimentitalea huanghaiensis TaxID=2682100 RepID=UPI0012ED6041|nr:hypothetical protein [Zongyanglinia huanghaiensis]
MTKAPCHFTRQARTVKLCVALVGIYTTLTFAVVVLQASWWAVAFLALPTLPALWDLWRNTRSELTLDATQVIWRSGQLSDSVTLDQINLVRFDTRWDFSVRVTLILTSGDKLRLPPQVLPPHLMLENALQLRGVQTERHHFTVF